MTHGIIICWYIEEVPYISGVPTCPSISTLQATPGSWEREYIYPYMQNLQFQGRKCQSDIISNVGAGRSEKPLGTEGLMCLGPVMIILKEEKMVPCCTDG